MPGSWTLRAALLGGLLAVSLLGWVWLGAPEHGTRLMVGFDDDLAERIGSAATTPMRRLGADAVRVTLQWAPGVTTPTAADVSKLDRAAGALFGLRLVLSVYGVSGASAPLTQSARADYCAYVSAIVRRYPSIRDVIVWNEPNKRQFWAPQPATAAAPSAPAAYEALLADCYDALHAARSNVDVLGFALAHDGHDDAASTSPGAFIRGVGAAYRASMRSARILDTVAFHPYPASAEEVPGVRHVGSTAIGEGDWNKLMYNLWLAFDGTPQPLPGDRGVTIWYTEWGVQTEIPAAKASLYAGRETVAVVDAARQGARLAAAVDLADCQPHVAAFFNFLVADEPVLQGWQSGALFADLTPKASSAQLRRAFVAASRGSVRCSRLAGGAPSSDYLPPSAPGALVAREARPPATVTLTWAAAHDASSPVSYRIYRGSSLVATTGVTTWSGSARRGPATYSVRAIDAAGNLGEGVSVVVAG